MPSSFPAAASSSARGGAFLEHLVAVRFSMSCAARLISISGIMQRKSHGRSRQRFKSRALTFQGGGMAPTLTPADVVRRIAAECADIDERGGVGIRLEDWRLRLCGNPPSNFASRGC